MWLAPHFCCTTQFRSVNYIKRNEGEQSNMLNEYLSDGSSDTQKLNRTNDPIPLTNVLKVWIKEQGGL